MSRIGISQNLTICLSKYAHKLRCQISWWIAFFTAAILNVSINYMYNILKQMISKMEFLFPINSNLIRNLPNLPDCLQIKKKKYCFLESILNLAYISMHLRIFLAEHYSALEFTYLPSIFKISALCKCSSKNHNIYRYHLG